MLNLGISFGLIIVIILTLAVGFTLVNQETLSLAGVAHLHGILRDEGVEEGIVLLGDGALFGAQNTTETLGLLTTRTSMRRNLNKHIRLGQIETGVGHFGHEDCVYL